ncbi:MAG TPA: PAS domain-containing protein, partial [Pirellulales bacterium]|nr:PAS domain-containing protein [Pirellulales bacterium]
MSDTLKLVCQLFDQADDLVCLATLRARPFYWNPAGRRRLGLTADADLSAQSLFGFYSKETQSLLRKAAFPAVRDAGRWEGKGALRDRQTGASFDVQITAFLVRHPRKKKSVCLALVHR